MTSAFLVSRFEQLGSWIRGCFLGCSFLDAPRPFLPSYILDAHKYIPTFRCWDDGIGPMCCAVLVCCRDSTPIAPRVALQPSGWALVANKKNCQCKAACAFRTVLADSTAEMVSFSLSCSCVLDLLARVHLQKVIRAWPLRGGRHVKDEN